MGFLNIDRMAEAFSDDLMQENIARLKTFELYHCLLDATEATAEKTRAVIGTAGGAYDKWIQYCDGGLLFDTVILSSRGYDRDLDLEFDTLADYNTQEVCRDCGLPAGYVIFAVRSYGDLICLRTDAEDARVYHWSLDDGDFVEAWADFENWLTEEIDTGIQLIADECLDPLDIKAEA